MSCWFHYFAIHSDLLAEKGKPTLILFVTKIKLRNDSSRAKIHAYMNAEMSLFIRSYSYHILQFVNK